MKSNLIVRGALAGLLILGSAAAFAGSPSASGSSSEGRAIDVDYSDLDLNTLEGAQTLYRRLRSASYNVCGIAPDAREIARKKLHDACTAKVMTAAVDKVDARTLTALHRSKKPLRQASAG